MPFIEPHIHMYARTTDDYEAMKEAGYEIVLEPAFWSGTDRSCAGSFFDYFRHLLEFERARARKYGIVHYSFLGVNAKEARNTDISFEVIEGMEEFLDHPACLGVGEIGFDLITPEEEEVFRRHVRLAEKREMPVIVHTPHTNKRVGVDRIIEILKQEKADPSHYVIDHNTEETIEASLAFGDALAGITLYPTKMNPERTASLIRRWGADRIILNSSADWGKSYPLNVSTAAREMASFGIPAGDIEKVTYSNVKRFLSRSPKFKPGL